MKHLRFPKPPSPKGGSKIPLDNFANRSNSCVARSLCDSWATCSFSQRAVGLLVFSYIICRLTITAQILRKCQFTTIASQLTRFVHGFPITHTCRKIMSVYNYRILRYDSFKRKMRVDRCCRLFKCTIIANHIFTVWRNYASVVLGVVILSVRPPSVRLSVHLSHACFVPNPMKLPAIFLYHMKAQSF